MAADNARAASSHVGDGQPVALFIPNNVTNTDAFITRAVRGRHVCRAGVAIDSTTGKWVCIKPWNHKGTCDE